MAKLTWGTQKTTKRNENTFEDGAFNTFSRKATGVGTVIL
jgi:hypothetical protein